MKRKWDIENEEINRKCIEEIITRIQEIEDLDSIGMIAAQDIIDIVNENLAPQHYNKGLNDAFNIIKEKIDNAEIDIDALKQ